MPKKKVPPFKKPLIKRRMMFFYSLAIGIVLFAFLSLKSSLPCANSISCISDLRGEYDANYSVGEYGGKLYNVPSYFSYVTHPDRVLGAKTAENKRIEVDLTTQTLHAFENNTEIMSFPISSGKWGKTPTGDFSIWIKLRYTRMKGGNKELHTFYDLPNVPYTMFFYNDQIPKWRGFGIHGAYWHNNFGHPMSHGCINVDLVNIEKLYNWATPQSSGNTTFATDENPGTKIVIYGTAPNE